MKTRDIPLTCRRLQETRSASPLLVRDSGGQAVAGGGSVASRAYSSDSLDVAKTEALPTYAGSRSTLVDVMRNLGLDYSVVVVEAAVAAAATTGRFAGVHLARESHPR